MQVHAQAGMSLYGSTSNRKYLDFAERRPGPSAGSCASWRKRDLGYNDSLLDMQGKGWHLDRGAFDAMLSAAVSDRGGALICGIRLREADRGIDDGYVLCFEDEAGTRITAGFMVDATGVAANAARRLGVARNQIDCFAVVSAVFDLEDPDAIPSQTLLEACELGWWYAAKLPKQQITAALAVEPCQQRRSCRRMAGTRQAGFFG